MKGMRIALILILALVGILYILDLSVDEIGAGSGDAQILAPVEVREYQGNQLSSLHDFRENSIRGPQQINETDYHLMVDGLTNTTMVYTYENLINGHKPFKKVVTLHCVEGWDVTILWEGFLVRDLLEDAGIDPRATTVILYAHDGYSTSFPLEYFYEHDILIAYRMNNLTLPAERGFPFQLVAEDKWGYKWIKWIERIELSDNRNYRGYWEQRGYSNTGNLSRGFFND